MGAERFELELTASVRTYGRQWVTLPAPFSNLAVTDATFAGHQVKWHMGPQGSVLMLEGNSSGALRITAVGDPAHTGRKGSMQFSIPPLPGAVMDVQLSDDDLVPEVLEVPGVPTRRQEDGKTLWRFKTDSGIIGQPTTYRGPDGHQYVAILAGVGGWAGAIVSAGLDKHDGTAALGFVNAMRDLPDHTTKGGTLYVFRLP